MPRAYDGALCKREIRIGGQRLLLGSSTAAPITTKITDIDNPPPGWRNVGSIAEHNLELKGSQELFEIWDGLPETLVFQERTRISAEINVQLNEWSLRNIWEVLGRPPLKHTLSPTAVATIESGTTRKVINLDTGKAALFSPGDIVVFDDGTGDYTRSANLGMVDSVDTTANTITLTHTLPDIPTGQVKVVLGTKTAYGDTTIVPIKAAAVFDSKDGTQIIHEFPQCVCISEYAPMLNRPKQQAILPMKLTAYSVYDTDLGKTVIVIPHIFGKNT